MADDINMQKNLAVTGQPKWDVYAALVRQLKACAEDRGKCILKSLPGVHALPMRCRYPPQDHDKPLETSMEGARVPTMGSTGTRAYRWMCHKPCH